MKMYRLFVILAATIASLAFSGCGEDKGPEVRRDVTRMQHFMRVDVSNDLLYMADVVCVVENIYGETKEYDFRSSSTVIVDDTWKSESGAAEPTQVKMTLKATPRVDSPTAESVYVVNASIQSEFTVYDQNNKIMGYNGFEKSMSQKIEKGEFIKPFIDGNFPVTYSFIVTKGNDGSCGVNIQ